MNIQIELNRLRSEARKKNLLVKEYGTTYLIFRKADKFSKPAYVSKAYSVESLETMLKKL